MEKFRDDLREIPDDLRAPALTVAGVNQVINAQVKLRIEPESISGLLAQPGGGSSSFVGWLGLIGVVERLQADLGGEGVAATEVPSAPDGEGGGIDA